MSAVTAVQNDYLVGMRDDSQPQLAEGFWTIFWQLNRHRVDVGIQQRWQIEVKWNVGASNSLVYTRCGSSTSEQAAHAYLHFKMPTIGVKRDLLFKALNKTYSNY